MQHNATYTIGFAAVVCLVCGIFVSNAAVALRDKQEANKLLDRQKKVLVVAGLMAEGEKLETTEIQTRFNKDIVAKIVDLRTGEYSTEVDPSTYDQRKATKDPDQSTPTESNKAKVATLEHYATVYEVSDQAGQLSKIILPVRGAGLWSTLWGYLAVSKDGDGGEAWNTIEGITFYEHAETPGLGGEVDNPSWKEQWKGRKIYDDATFENVAINVKKGKAGTVEDAPYEVDGLSGATITANGVTYTMQFWMGDRAFGPFLENLRGG